MKWDCSFGIINIILKTHLCILCIHTMYFMKSKIFKFYYLVIVHFKHNPFQSSLWYCFTFFFFFIKLEKGLKQCCKHAKFVIFDFRASPDEVGRDDKSDSSSTCSIYKSSSSSASNCSTSSLTSDSVSNFSLWNHC